MNVDEILADVGAACDLPDGAVPTHIIILVEYAEPGAADDPGAPRLTFAADEDLSVWNGVGMIHWALAHQNAVIAAQVAACYDPDEDEDD